ncbi:hypothetical protein C0995_007800 [Termitomyces sp. Mi166|nr:hypothetical protein C0995_007800 [Termitomyces sp. Mi166\
MYAFTAVMTTSVDERPLQNEKKKDEDLTQRIDKILQLRDDTLRGVDLKNVEHSVDCLISDLESERDLSQTIVHVDMDAFYANVELLDNPDLAGKPFGVRTTPRKIFKFDIENPGFSPYYGVRSGMPAFIAKKLCPGLIFVPLHFARYMELSNVVMSVLCRYDPTFFPAGCDEAYLNITTYCKTHNMSAVKCVQELREAVFKETRLTASAGIAPTKNKPNGQFELSFNSHSILSFLRELPIRKIPGVGRVNERLLESIGIKTCGDIFTHRTTIYLMDKQFGSHYLFRIYLGVTSNIVKPITREERKSIGAERTFSPLADKAQILDKLNDVAVDLEKDMIENGWAARTVTLKFKLDTYQIFTRAKSFDRWITKKEDLFATGKELLLPEFPLTLRLIGLRVTKLKDLRAAQDPVNTIKRFFEPLQDSRPRKKIKTGLEHVDAGSMESHKRLYDGPDETMPGFYEMDEDDHNPYLKCHTAAGDLTTENVEHTPISPDAAPRTHSVVYLEELHPMPPPESNKGASRPKPIKSHSTERAGRSTSSETAVDEEDVYNCPICAKMLRTDNQGLNSHIDFCLSRAAIRQAHAEATSPLKPSTLGFKPISKEKGKSNR